MRGAAEALDYGVHMADATTTPELTIIPANEHAGRISRPCSGRAGPRRRASAGGSSCSRGSPSSRFRRRARPPAPRADRLRTSGVEHDERARRVPRRRTRRLVCSRASHRLPGPVAQHSRALGGESGGQDRTEPGKVIAWDELHVGWTGSDAVFAHRWRCVFADRLVARIQVEIMWEAGDP